MSTIEVGVEGTLCFQGKTIAVSHPGSAYAAETKFPSSAPPLKYASLATNTDPYKEVDAATSALVPAGNETAVALLRLTHALAAARAESDRVLTELVNASAGANKAAGVAVLPTPAEQAAAPSSAPIPAAAPGADDGEGDAAAHADKKARTE